MRPSRTLPLALSLAALAALPLLSACVDGEPGRETIGPELPEGVSASPDGSIVIGKGLAAPEDSKGFALGEEDWEALASMEGFDCYSIWDCYFKCPWDTLCVCEWNGQRWECVVIPSEDFCKWFKHGCGEVGEGADWKHHVSLDCPAGVTRGRTANCEIKTGGVNLNLLRVDAWWTDLGGVFQYGGMTAGGVATRTARIKVALSMEMIGESVVLERTVNVRPRSWKLQERNVPLRWVKKLIDRSAWGRYVGGDPVPKSWSAHDFKEGSGPWTGTHYVAGWPSIASAAMYAHRDLLSDGDSYPIPNTDTICGVSGRSVGVHDFNVINCGYRRSLENFRDAVVTHERRHQESLNECIRSVNTDGRLAAVEAIVKNSKGDAEQAALNLWTKGLVPALLDAKRTAQGPVNAGIWHWRESKSWRYGGKTLGHTGTEGCPTA